MSPIGDMTSSRRPSLPLLLPEVEEEEQEGQEEGQEEDSSKKRHVFFIARKLSLKSQPDGLRVINTVVDSLRCE